MPDPAKNPDSLTANRDRRKYDRFHETLVTPVPATTYRSQQPARLSDVSLTARAVRFIAGLLIILLAVRFAISYFNLANSGAWASFFFLTTDWVVAPFQGMFGESTLPTTHAFVDWAVLAAIGVTALAAWVIWLVLRPRARY